MEYDTPTVKQRNRNKRGHICIVQTTVCDRNNAGRLSRALVKARLAACVQICRIRSIYRWKGKIESAREYLLMAKTRSELVSRVIAFIRRKHVYELPEIVVTRIEHGLTGYLAWVRKETA